MLGPRAFSIGPTWSEWSLSPHCAQANNEPASSSNPRETSPAVPGIALTGFDAAAYAAGSMEAGFLLHFTKPIATEKLKTAIEEIAKAQRSGTGAP